MLRYPEATPCPVFANSKTLSLSVYERTEELNFTTEIQAALRQANPRRRKSVWPQVRPDEDTTQPIAAGGKAGTARVEGQYHHERSARAIGADNGWQTGAGPLPAMRGASFLLPGRRNEPNDPMTVKHQHEGANQQDLTHMRKKPRRHVIFSYHDVPICAI